jgi:hypothetical protein
MNWIRKLIDRRQSDPIRVTVDSIDSAPEELYEQEPFEVTLLRQISASVLGDDGECWVGELTRPLRWNRDGTDTQVTHILLADHWLNAHYRPGVHFWPVKVIYVVDSSLLSDASVDPEKCHYAAIGAAHDANVAAR